jgi:hypothetical protein
MKAIILIYAIVYKMETVAKVSLMSDSYSFIGLASKFCITFCAKSSEETALVDLRRRV